MDIRIMMYACCLANEADCLTTDIQDYTPAPRCGVSFFGSFEDAESKEDTKACLERSRATLAEYGVRCTKIKPNDSETCFVDVNWNGNRNRKVSEKFWHCLCRDFTENHPGPVAVDFQGRTYAEQERMIGDWLEESGLCEI